MEGKGEGVRGRRRKKGGKGRESGGGKGQTERRANVYRRKDRQKDQPLV